MKYPPILIAADQAMSGPTGIVVARYHVGHGAETLEAETVTGVTEIADYLYDFAINHRGYPLGIATEAGYFSQMTPRAGLTTEHSGGWIEGIAEIFMVMGMWRRPILIRSYKAPQWRSIFGNTGCRTTADWKDWIMLWTQDDPLIRDHHQADAKGILSKLGQDLTNEGVITFE